VLDASSLSDIRRWYCRLADARGNAPGL